MNLKEEYTDKMERLHREATGAASEDEEFDSRCLTRIVKEQDEVMVLQLHAQDPDGPVWKRARIPSRRSCSIQERSTPLLMTVPKEGGLVVAGVANKREGNNIFVGDLVVGQLQDHGPWAAEGEVEKVCPGGYCFVPLLDETVQPASDRTAPTYEGHMGKQHA